MGRRDSVLRFEEGRAGARERCPWRERRNRAGGNARPGRRWLSGGKGREAGEGGRAWKWGADAESQERGTNEGAAPRSAANGGRAQRRAQQDL